MCDWQGVSEKAAQNLLRTRVLRASLSELLFFDTCFDCLAQVLADYSHEGPDSKYFKFESHMVSVATTQIYYLSMKAAIGRTHTNV